MTRETTGALIVTGTVFGALGAVLALALSVPAPQVPVKAPESVTVTLPPCDATDPPTQGPCWLWDDDTIAVWPYPYAPTPLYVLAGSDD